LCVLSMSLLFYCFIYFVFFLCCHRAVGLCELP
jgi:hypothetical protein